MITGLFALAALLTCLFSAGTVEASRGSRGESKIYGIIDSMPNAGLNGTWIISGREVEVTDRTRIKEKHGQAAKGRYVEVEGSWEGNRFIAYELEVERNRENRRDRRDRRS
ncbi:hypothetical protein VU02_02930 [Desulfobulbus sp. N2]|nr:hypothetical protein [Desulfobulbus sp. US4]MCW5204865.1 hypothetical protein [Desulfobulbus sp. N2]WLE97569.1 MAG: DUF5666 domain-containing protein [Candidatus Electrothrix communis]